jgi:hypothetical protein
MKTFSGIDFATGVKAAQEFSGQVPDGVTTAQGALAWDLVKNGAYRTFRVSPTTGRPSALTSSRTRAGPTLWPDVLAALRTPHHGIFAAVRSHDGELAARLLREHIEWSYQQAKTATSAEET